MQKITPFLWFDGQAEAAAKHYTSIIPRSKIVQTTHYGEGGPMPAGSVMTVAFELDGQLFTALNAGPQYHFTPAVSFVINCADQAELDRINAALLSGGGEQQPCAWVTDKFGLSWQVVPRILPELLAGDPTRAARVMAALFQMKKLDLATLQRAYDGK